MSVRFLCDCGCGKTQGESLEGRYWYTLSYSRRLGDIVETQEWHLSSGECLVRWAQKFSGVLGQAPFEDPTIGKWPNTAPSHS